MMTGLVTAQHNLDSPKIESQINTPALAHVEHPSLDVLHEPKPRVLPNKAETSKTEDYIQAFINNQMVRKVFPDTMNWINIFGNTFSFCSQIFGFSNGVKKIATSIGSLSTKAFMIANSTINFVERIYAKNFLSALGFLNDILIAGLVEHEHTYLARGTASGVYNMANSLARSLNRDSFTSFDDHASSTIKAFKKFFTNLFSRNVIANFLNHKNNMWAIFGGIFSNIGALSWMFSGKVKAPTLVRDVAGVMMDIEQLNPGHLKEGRKEYFFSGLTLAIGTICDLLTKVMPKSQNLFTPLTFIFDGLGRHLLRIDQNKIEIEKQKVPV